MKWIPAVVLFALSALSIFAAQAGDNSDARALAGIMYLPAIGLAAIGVIATTVAAVW